MKRVSLMVAVSCGLIGAATVLPGAAVAKPKAAGPSLNVIGWGINRLFVPKGTTVKSTQDCEDIVASDDGPIGPPQQVYFTVYTEATAIPDHSPTEFKDSLPEGGEQVDEPEFTKPVPFSHLFSKGASFGAPEKSVKNLYYTALLSYSAEEGTYEGPSAEEFDGTYSFTAQAKVGPHTLTSTAKVTVDCPLLR